MIRFAEMADHPKLAELYQLIAQAGITPAFFNWDLDKALTELKVAKTLIYSDQSKIHSFISYQESVDALEITALGTHPQSRKQGFLQSLMSTLCAIAAQHSKLLWLEVHELNAPAVQLYQKWGFVLVRIRPNYYSDGAGAMVMTKEPT